MSSSLEDGNSANRDDRAVGANSTAPKVALGVLSVAALIISLYVMWSARLLRPANDDYGLAHSMDRGLLPSVWHWWSSWTGDLTTTFSNLLFVGLPVLHLPWSVASALTFMAAAASAASVLWWITFFGSSSCESVSRLIRLTVLMTPVSLIAWWGFWWVSASFSAEGDDPALIAVGVSMWQNLNAAYVIVPLLIVVAWLIMEKRRRTAGPTMPFLYLLIGLVAGLAGPVFAASAVIMIGTIAVGSWLRTQTAPTNRGTLWLMALIGTALGALVSHFSPGSQARKLALPDPQINQELLFRLASDGIPGGLRDWWSAISSPGAVTVVVVFLGVSLLMSLQGWSPRVGYLINLGIGLLGFSLVMSWMNRMSEPFAYEAYWHLIAPRTMVWLALATLAIGIGCWLGSPERSVVTTPLTVLASAVGIVVIAASLVSFGSQVQARYVQWESGPAPWAGAISDIEVPWIRAAWEQLIMVRDGPPRSLNAEL